MKAALIATAVLWVLLVVGAYMTHAPSPERPGTSEACEACVPAAGVATWAVWNMLDCDATDSFNQDCSDEAANVNVAPRITRVVHLKGRTAMTVTVDDGNVPTSYRIVVSDLTHQVLSARLTVR